MSFNIAVKTYIIHSQLINSPEVRTTYIFCYLGYKDRRSDKRYIKKPLLKSD